MATVRKRTLPSGEIRWQADYVDLKGKRRAKQFEKRKDADAYLVGVRGDLQRGTHVAPGASITVKEAGAIWIERAKRDRLVESTIRQYEQHLDHHIEPELGTVRLSELTTPRVTEFADEMLKTRSRALTRKIMVSLRSLIDEAIRRGHAGHNPAKLVKLRASHDEIGEDDDIEMPTKDELKALLTTTAGRWRPLIITAAFTGMRASELRALDWAHVDLKGGEIRVRRRVDAWGTFGPPKSKAGKRTIPLPSLVVQTLREWRLACPKGDSNKLDLVFPSAAGGVLAHAVILKDVFYPLQVAAGVVNVVKREETLDGQKVTTMVPVAKYGLHALRHAAVSLWIEKKFTPKRIQLLAGHSSIRVTYDIYGYLFEANEGEDQEAMTEIERRLLS